MSDSPATEVRVTATFGAVARAVATNKGLLDDPFAESLVRAAGVQDFTRMVENELYSDDFDDGGEDPTTTGLIAITGAHTRFVDDFLAAAGRAGIRQVVILGSGLDTRAYRLWWPPGTTVYEIDQPDIIDFKSGVLRGLGAQLAANRRAIGADLRHDWPEALRRTGFDAAQRAVWIAENLFAGYLSPNTQNRLLENLTAMSAAGSRLAADHTPAGEYRDVPQHLAACGWATAERKVADLFSAFGMASAWRGGPEDEAISPRYVTATRSAGMHPPAAR